MTVLGQHDQSEATIQSLFFRRVCQQAPLSLTDGQESNIKRAWQSRVSRAKTSSHSNALDEARLIGPFRTMARSGMSLGGKQMRKSVVGFVSIFLLLSAGCACPNYVFLGSVVPRAQETGQWCWVAAEQMTMACYGMEYFQEQCVLATKDLNALGGFIARPGCPLPPDAATIDCCGEHKSACYCDVPGWPNFRGHGFNATETTKPNGLSWNEVTGQICSGHPVVFTIEWGSDSAHQYVASGYKTAAGNRKMIWVIDPLGPTPDPAEARWWRFTDNYTKATVLGVQGRHSIDYIDISPSVPQNISCP